MSFEDEYTSGRNVKNPITPFLPALGLILIIALGAIAFVASAPIHEFVYEQFFEEDEFDQQIERGGDESFFREEIQYVIAGATFVILMLLMGFLYALFAPKGEKIVTEKELKKEKEERQREMLERKRRKQLINKKVAAERERREKESRKR